MSKKSKFKNPTEVNDPTPMKSRVAFKRPLSAHERVLRALKARDAIERYNASPVDDTHDSHITEELTPHQIIYDPNTGEPVRHPDTGEMMTAGEHVMLQHERAEAKKQIAESLRQKSARKQAELLKKLSGKGAGKAKAAKGEDDDSTSSDESDDSDES